MPKDLPPPKSTAHWYFMLWDWDGTLERIHHALYVATRERPEGDKSVDIPGRTYWFLHRWKTSAARTDRRLSVRRESAESMANLSPRFACIDEACPLHEMS